MKRVLAVSGCCVTLLLLGGFWSPPAMAADACVSASCHMNYGSAALVHGPVAVGDCQVCHQATGVAHPGPSPAFQLKKTGARLCEQCHPNPAAGKAHSHAPVIEGKCLACHDPHGAVNPMLLIADQGDL